MFPKSVYIRSGISILKYTLLFLLYCSTKKKIWFKRNKYYFFNSTRYIVYHPETADKPYMIHYPLT